MIRSILTIHPSIHSFVSFLPLVTNLQYRDSCYHLLLPRAIMKIATLFNFLLVVNLSLIIISFVSANSDGECDASCLANKTADGDEDPLEGLLKVPEIISMTWLSLLSGTNSIRYQMKTSDVEVIFSLSSLPRYSPVNPTSSGSCGRRSTRISPTSWKRFIPKSINYFPLT